MGEVPAVSKEMAIPLGWTLCFVSSWVFPLGLRPMYCSMPYDSTLILLDFYLISVGIVVYLICRGCVKDPRTTLHYYFV